MKGNHYILSNIDKSEQNTFDLPHQQFAFEVADQVIRYKLNEVGPLSFFIFSDFDVTVTYTFNNIKINENMCMFILGCIYSARGKPL